MGERLDSWKDIADYLGRDVRTVQRWEIERHLPIQRLPGGDRPRVYALKPDLDRWLQGNKETPPDFPSIAVLPFVNLTGSKENEYFGDGLADEIINALTRIPGLRVIARTSSFAFRGREQDVREIGARLGASTLLEGSVRREGNRVRISAQHVSSADGYHLWSECYDRELADIFAIQDEIARAIANALRLGLSPAILVERSTDNLDAYRLWLQGRHAAAQFTPDTFAKARECFAAAVARDPRFAHAYLSDAELLCDASQFGLVPADEAASQARVAVQRALALNDTLGEAHALQGALLGILEYDWAAAARSFERALQLSPGSATVLMRHAWFHLVPKMHIPEALEQMRRAVAQDPLSPYLHAFSGLVWIVARDYERGLHECTTALDLAPEFYPARWFLGTALIFLGRNDEALEHFLRVKNHWGIGPTVLAGMCLVYGLIGRDREARQTFDELDEVSRTTKVTPLNFAWGYLGVHDERVFDWLDKAIDARHPDATHLPSMPIYDGIRQDPRFKKLLEKMRLADL